MAIYKEKNGTWRVVFRGIHKRGFKSKFLAEQFEAKIRLQENDPTIGVKFHSVALDYLEYKEGKVTHGTFDKIDRHIKQHIIPNTPNKDLSRITKLDARKFDEYVRSLDYATSTKNTIMIYYKAIFTHAEIFYNLKSNPTKHLTSIQKTEDEKLSNAKINPTWTIDEFNRFNSELADDDYKLLFNILYFTGIRLGEALALTWNDYTDGFININKSLTRKTKKGAYEIKSPKNIASLRNIQLGDYLNELLSNNLEKKYNEDDFSKDNFLLGGLKPLNHETTNRRRRAAIKSSGVPSITNHGMRHSHGSNLVSNGVPITAVSRRLGHENITTTLNIYTHLIETDNDILIDAINISTGKITK